jgi:hypothetical protein
MKVTHILGHHSNWNIEAYLEQNIGDYFLITAFTHGIDFESKKLIQKVFDKSMIDLQFYGKKESANINKGKLSEISFHPANCNPDEITNIYFENCVKQAIGFQEEKGFDNIIIPNFYENDEVENIIFTLNSMNSYLSKNRKEGKKYFMTLPFANHVIIDKNKVEQILFACTDMDIIFDGYFITCETKLEFKRKLSTDIKIFRNLSRVLKTLNEQSFETIYAYANWDALIYLAQTNIDYITIGTYENLRKFDINRFVQDDSGGGSKGYYFSEKLLNMIKAENVTVLRETDTLDFIRNERNIFSDIILKEGYAWNIHKPDVNKNYLLSISRLFSEISSIDDMNMRKKFVLDLIERAISIYFQLEKKNVFLDNESSNYHLSLWKTYLANS